VLSSAAVTNPSATATANTTPVTPGTAITTDKLVNVVQKVMQAVPVNVSIVDSAAFGRKTVRVSIGAKNDSAAGEKDQAANDNVPLDSPSQQQQQQQQQQQEQQQVVKVNAVQATNPDPVSAGVSDQPGSMSYSTEEFPSAGTCAALPHVYFLVTSGPLHFIHTFTHLIAVQTPVRVYTRPRPLSLALYYWVFVIHWLFELQA
jgi:hypothetical protein